MVVCSISGPREEKSWFETFSTDVVTQSEVIVRSAGICRALGKIDVCASLPSSVRAGRTKTVSI